MRLDKAGSWLNVTRLVVCGYKGTDNSLENSFARLANVELNLDVPPAFNPFSNTIFLAVRTDDLQIATVEPCDARIAKTDVR